MNLAFTLFKYFPFGGLQRDFLRIAKACQSRGHAIHVYTMSWDGEKAPGFHIHLMKKRGWQNHTRSRYFYEQVAIAVRHQQHDLVIGFNKMPDLDLYYAADVCYKARIHESRHALYRLLPRYRHWQSFEQAVFEKDKKTEIMLISQLEQPRFMKHYGTEAARFHLLPPGISRDRIAPSNANQIRTHMRSTLQLKDEEHLLLMVGSGFKTKGVDRAIKAFAALPKELQRCSVLAVVGQDHPDAFIKLAHQHQIKDRIRFLGGRDDVSHLLLAADLLLHPAYHENTGTVLLEALVAGLPVLTTDVCGYAHYILEAEAGIVLSSPFQQNEFDQALLRALLQPKADWRLNALTFAKQADIYSLPETAADVIEQYGRRLCI